MSPEAINDYMEKIKDWKRYQNAFARIYFLMQHQGVTWENVTQDRIASAIIELSKESQAQARNAFAAVSLIPGFHQLKFHPTLGPYKRQWNQNVEKYATFWAPHQLLQQLAGTPLSSHASLGDVRDRLILTWRLLGLYRSVDLARTVRTLSLFDGTPFVQVQRKCWTSHKWERVLRLPSLPHISPWHLMQKYVQLTAHLVPPGTPLLRSTSRPYFPLTSNSIASITKKR